MIFCSCRAECAMSLVGHLLGGGGGVGDKGDAGSGADAEVGVAAPFGPLVVLLGRTARRGGSGVTLGEDADHVGAGLKDLHSPVVAIAQSRRPVDYRHPPVIP